MQIIGSTLSALKAYRFFSLFDEGDKRVNHDDDRYSSLLSFERLIHVDGDLEKHHVVGIGHIQFTLQPIVCWAVPITLLNLAETDVALVQWSQWFTTTVEEGKKLVKKYERFRKETGDEKTEHYARVRLGAIGKCVVDPNNIWWRPLEYMFKYVDHAELNRRYSRICKIVREVKCTLPTNGIAILKRIWMVGCEWNERETFELRCPPTPYSELGGYLNTHQIDDLAHWIEEIRQASQEHPCLPVARFHRYLRTVVANFNVDNCDTEVARLELALWPRLKRLFSQEDNDHQCQVKAIKTTKPLVLDGMAYHYVESLNDCVHRFANPTDGDHRLLVFGEKNGVEVYLSWARMEKTTLRRGRIHYSPKRLSFFEIGDVRPINWTRPPSNLVEVLKQLGETMPRELGKTLCVDAKGNACWLPTGDRVPLDSDRIQLFLYQNSSQNAERWINQLGYAALK